MKSSVSREWCFDDFLIVHFMKLFFSLEMVIPEVDKKLLEDLESMGFPTARATRALHFSGELLIDFHCPLTLDVQGSSASWAMIC